MVAALAVPRRVIRATDRIYEDHAGIEIDPSLVTVALDAARAAGATYAEVHYRIRQEEWWLRFSGEHYPVPSMKSYAGLGVRALFNGYWGFAGHDGRGTVDMAAQLGRDAAYQAKIAATGKPRSVELASAPAAVGRWDMPVAIDPFTVSLEEKADFVSALSGMLMRQRFGVNSGASLLFIKESRTFASSEGAHTVQTIYQTGGGIGVSVPADGVTEEPGARSVDVFSTAGAGWEYIRNAPVEEIAQQVIAEALRSRKKKPVEIGRFDIAFDAQATAGLLNGSIGLATGLERALGYEANTEGTSYLNDPLVMLGTYRVGSPLVNVSANRSMPGGAATVQWDAEGVVPQEVALITDGVVTDFQTTRESASSLRPFYDKQGRPVRSNGCAGTFASTDAVRSWTPNIVLHPGASEVSFDDLVKNIKRGYAVCGGHVRTDFQLLNGDGTGDIVYEVVDGKLGTAVAGAQYLFRTPEFWKSIIMLGGARSARSYGIDQISSVPSRDWETHTVRAVPVLARNVVVTDTERRA